MMLQHLPCPSDSMFETIKAHPTFNYSNGCVYCQDLYDFPEEEILAMCPNSVQKVTKMRNSSNMVLLTFFGSTPPDRVNVRPINLRVHSRQCPRYRLEQDILQLANSQFITLGSARQKDGIGATSYASLTACSSAESAGPKTTPPATSRSVGVGGPVHLANRDRSAMVFPVVSVQPSVTPSVPDRASCEEDGLSMETSDDIFTAVPSGPTVSESAVLPDPCPPRTGRSYDCSHQPPIGRKAAVQRPGTSQLPVSSFRLIISS
ncbi:hypothetical protein E2C01_078751 [Portunus trituberculatus]|uniref:Uncharacterized protein n=1 Tax=Portunus trituberculatus TaxID=210409 RepID=A0A5B7IR25_PORTR|nr:hypothetical protein [Portunus trituberculatus]